MADKEFTVQFDTLKKLIDMHDGTFAERAASSSAHNNGMTWVEAAALGIMAPDVRVVAAFGNNTDVDQSTVPEELWPGGGSYPYMTAATSLEVVSTSAADTALGTGARSVIVIGLDVNYVEQSDVVVMSGTTPVQLPRQYFRINMVELVSAGTGRVNAGTINIRNTGAGTIRAIMPLGTGSSQQAVYTVPAGHTFLIRSTIGTINLTSGIDKNVTIGTHVRLANGTSRRRGQFSLSSIVPFHLTSDFVFPLPEKTDVSLEVTFTATNDVNVTAGFTGVLIKNTAIQ